MIKLFFYAIKYFRSLVFLLMLVSSASSAQDNSILKNIDRPSDAFVVDEYQIDLPKQRREIMQNEPAWQFAVPVETNYPFTLQAEGDKKGGNAHYLLKIKANDAFALNFTLQGLLKGQVRSVFVKNVQSGIVYGPYDPVQNEFDLTAFPVFMAPEIVIEIIADKKLKSDMVKLHRLGITYDEESFPSSGECNVDINCEEGMPWQEVKNAVARIVYDNGWLCSGTLVNNTRNDFTPYFLTANHCIDDDYSAANMVFYFKYESLYCDGPEEDYPNPNAYTISGATLKASKYDVEGKLDFSLLEISEPVPESYEPFFVGWNASSDAPGTTVGIHHPKGDVKKICIDYDSPVTSHFAEYDRYTFWRILRWDVGVTEGGSSGSGLFNSNFKLVGTLTGGEATCDNPVNDYYLKFSEAFDRYSDSTAQLKYWLDPENKDAAYWYGWPMENQTDEDEYYIGPNPADRNLTVYNQNLSGNVSVKIWDLGGNLMWQKAYSNVDRLIVINIPDNLVGLHVLQIKTEQKNIKKKLVIQ